MFKSLREFIKSIKARDPAAKNGAQIILLYSGVHALIHYRIAHFFYKIHWYFVARWISQCGRFWTGIEIHPGATIGRRLFIDHGMGVVIGETCIIGKGCRLYQGVTLGALSFSKNDDGTLVKGLPRHPILEDNVTVYAGASILGRITIGKGSIIGGNVWLTHSVPEGSRIVQSAGKAKPGEVLTGKTK